MMTVVIRTLTTVIIMLVLKIAGVSIRIRRNNIMNKDNNNKNARVTIIVAIQ